MHLGIAVECVSRPIGSFIGQRVFDAMKPSLTALLLFVLSANAYSEGRNGTFAFVLDNDLFVGTDKKYTNGLRVSWLAESAEANVPGLFGSGYSQVLKDTLDFLPVFGDESRFHSASIALQQAMITPDDIEIPDLLPEQTPYAGVLTLDMALYAWNEQSFHELQLSFGVVGPDSGAEQMQKEVHKLLGADKPRGWDNQVGRKLVGEIAYTFGRRLKRREYASGYGWDIVGNLGVTLGNFITDASAASVFRWGKNLPQNYNVYYAGSGSESALLGLSEGAGSGGWFLYAGVIAEANAYSYIESAVEDTHSLSAETFSGGLITGLSYCRSNLMLGFSLQSSTSAIEEDRDPITYGSVYAIWGF